MAVTASVARAGGLTGKNLMYSGDGGATGGQRGADVLHPLTGLHRNTAVDDVLRARLDAGHAGNEHPLTVADGHRASGHQRRVTDGGFRPDRTFVS